jgi:hypothetical protein
MLPRIRAITGDRSVTLVILAVPQFLRESVQT